VGGGELALAWLQVHAPVLFVVVRDIVFGSPLAVVLRGWDSSPATTHGRERELGRGELLGQATEISL
jgi:hypothetical protein